MRKLASNWCNYCVSVSPTTAGVNQLCLQIREAATKKTFFSGLATERGGGVKGLTTKKKKNFLKLEKKIPKNVATKLEGGGEERRS